MTSFIQHIDQESDAALSLLSKSEIQFVYSAWCEVRAGSSTLTVKTAFIQVSARRFMSIETDWLFTSDLDGLHHHELVIRSVSRPGTIFYEPDRPPGGANFKADHTSLFLGAKRKVSQVDVLVAKEVGQDETSEYDAGLVITRDDGLQLALVRTESIAGLMYLAHEYAEIKTLLESLTIRRTYLA